jgi:hypothetical protein
MNWMKRNKSLILSWAITAMCILITVHMSRQYTRVCTHIMNISDGLYETNATQDAKNRVSYLANLCFVGRYNE